jgi:hypothetical protein
MLVNNMLSFTPMNLERPAIVALPWLIYILMKVGISCP